MLSEISALTIAILLATPGLLLAQKKPKPASRAKVSTTKQTKPAVFVGELSEREREIISEINLARSEPKSYVRYVEQFRTYYQGVVINFPDGHRLTTNEGVRAVDEAIAFLKSAKAQPPLELRAGLIQAARDHLKDLETTGKTGHRGSDGSIPEHRLSRHGAWGGSVGEDIVYESRNARDSVVALIIDDGVKNRGHRQNIFKLGFKVIGVALGKPAQLGSICIITFAGSFSDKGASKSATTKSAPAARKY